MNSFSISQLSQYSGVKPHTIRMWEQRYNALQPIRSQGNTRYYSGDQLRRLLNIVSLIKTDRKVSELCSMPDDQLSALILNESGASNGETSEYFVSQLISAGMSYNQVQFENLFEHCLSHYDISKAYKLVIYPLLVRVGLMWAADEIPSVQEHFITNLVRQKLLRSIDALPPARANAKKWILFLPEDEFHEIGLLFASFIIRQTGDEVVYLGSSVSSAAVLTAIRELKPEYLLLFFVRYNVSEDAQNYLMGLNSGFNGQKIFVAGNNKLLSQLEYTGALQWLKYIDSLEREVNSANGR